MLKSFIALSTILYFSIILTTNSPFQNNTLFQDNAKSFINQNIQYVYATHNDDDDDDDNRDDKLDQLCKNDNYKDKEDYDFKVCKDYDNDDDNGKDEGDNNDYEEKIKIKFPFDEYLSEEDLPSSISSLEDYHRYVEEYHHYLESTNPSSPTVDDKEEDEEEEENKKKVSSEVEDSSDKNLDRYSDLIGSSDKTSEDHRYSDLVDLSNPPPFSKFQDPIPKQPGQPLHPDLPTIPSLPPEAAEPRNPPIPPP